MRVRLAVALLILGVIAPAAVVPGFTGLPSYYVDATGSACGGGSDSNTGRTPAQAWATLAHADATVPASTNPILWLRMPQTCAYRAIPVWRGLVAYPELAQAPGVTSTTDVASGSNGTLVSSPPYSGAYLSTSSGGSYVDLGVIPQIGTGDATFLLDTDASGASDNQVFFGSGTFGGLAGWGLARFGGHYLCQIQDTAANAISVNAASNPWSGGASIHVLGCTVTRGSATGLQLYVDGVASGTPGNLTGSWATASLTSTAHGAFGARMTTGASWGLFATQKAARGLVYSRALSAAEMATMAVWMQGERWSYFPYQANFFTGNFSTSATFLQQRSTDGTTFYAQDNATYPSIPGGHGWANANVLKDSTGKCWMVHQTPLVPNQPPYLAESMDCNNWHGVGYITAGGGVGMSNDVGWFTDTDGSIHLIGFTLAAQGQQSGSLIEFHPLSAQMTGAWSTPINLGLAANIGENPQVAYLTAHGPYNIFFSFFPASGNYPIYQATSTSLTGLYAVTNTNPFGIGTTVHQDGASFLPMGGSVSRFYFDEGNNGAGGEQFVQSTNNWTSFGSVTAVQPSASAFHAGSVILHCLPGSTLPAGCQ